MKRWIKICLVMSMTLLVTGGHVRYLYAGEFGGFDIDIGAGDDIFDNWEEEQEGKKDSAEPEQKENESNNEGMHESSNGNGSNNDGNNSNNNGGSNENNNNSDKNSANNSNTEAGQWNAESSVGISDRHDKKSPQAENSERNSKANSADSHAGKSDSTANESDFKREEKEIVAGETEINANEKNTANDKKTDSQKKVDTEKAKISDTPEAESTISHSKVIAFGAVSTAIGMAKASPGLKFYNSNDKNKDNYEKTTENNNKNIYFEHPESVPENEYPRIRVIRRAENQDVTILSLRYNDEEIFFHQEGDTLIFDQPVTRKRNRISLLAVIDGRRIVQMPVWEF